MAAKSALAEQCAYTIRHVFRNRTSIVRNASQMQGSALALRKRERQFITRQRPERHIIRRSLGNDCRRGYATVTNGAPSIMVNDLKHQEILVNFSDAHTVRYPSFWLRDHCQCSVCQHPYTKQRQINTFELDPQIQATGVTSTAEGLQLTWSQDGHESLYPWEWLSRHVPFHAAGTIKHPRNDWQHVAPSSAPHIQVSHDSVMNSDDGLGTFLEQIRTYGFSFVAGTPRTPEATIKLLERISFIRPTQYGPFWDFTAEAKPVDTAYTNLALPLHTDTTYFNDPAGLQLFHCLQAATQGGGQSTFTDGFAAAAHLFKIEPEYYNILSSVRVASHASGSSDAFGTFINNAPHAGGFPVFTHSIPHVRPHPKNLTQIRWNNDDRHSSTQWPSHERMIMWYRAAKLWQEIIASKEFQFEVQLQPGTPVIFDNWRTLHGRRAFEGLRRVCGGYIGMDEFLARSRMVSVRLAANEGLEDGKTSESEKENEEQIKKEQAEEEKIDKERKEKIEPDVVPQKDQGVDRPIAS